MNADYPLCFIELFQPSVAFYIETSHLFHPAKQLTGFDMKCNTRLQWVNSVLNEF